MQEKNQSQSLPKKFNFQEREEHWRNYWEEEKIYQFDENSDKPVFSVDTPPPYVSADHLHTGHIMSYSQAEFVVRFKRMKGFNVFYPMGFDDNGLPTERFVEKKYNIDKSKISRPDFIEKCLEETKLGAQTYKNLWNLLGISIDWSKTYSTIDDHCRKISQWSFIDLFNKKRVYRAKKPALWCTCCQTPIAQADLEPEEKDSQLVYIKTKTETDEELIFATTRPELLPACMGMSVNPDDERYKNLVGKKITLPITNKEVTLTTDEEADKDFATGVVYFCSYGGSGDIDWLQRHPDAKPTELINPDGKLNKNADKYEGQTIEEARKNIVKDLQELGAIEKIEPIKHSVQVHERCSTDVEYVESTQWFIKILDKKEEFIKRGEELEWFPPKMRKIYEDWVNGLKWDWCISRQRYYGVPFPVWYCAKCNEVILPKEEDLPVDPTGDKPPTKKCPSCGHTEIIPEEDVMDTWTTSSLTPIIASRLVGNKEMQKKLYPMTLRPQAFEIIRTWLFDTVVKSHFHHDHLPFKEAMISGHGLDDQGRKISKRLGNYVEPEKIITEYGADSLRYWATGATLGESMRYNTEEIKKGKRTVTKIWNAAKFCLMHLENFTPDQKVAYENLEDPDKWVLDQLQETILEAEKYFEQYEYAKARGKIDHFFWSVFTDNYLEFVKHRLYNEEKNSPSLLAAQTALYECLNAILKLYAPILPFVTEEIYQTAFAKEEKTKSIHISAWPQAKEEWQMNDELKQEFAKALEVVNEVRKHKSENNISLGKEIDSFKPSAEFDQEKYGEFIKQVGRIKELL